MKLSDITKHTHIGSISVPYSYDSRKKLLDPSLKIVSLPYYMAYVLIDNAEGVVGFISCRDFFNLKESGNKELLAAEAELGKEFWKDDSVKWHEALAVSDKEIEDSKKLKLVKD